MLCCCRFYCEPCEQCVCVLCALHEHKEHEVSSLADGLERHRGAFDSLLDDCKTRIDAVRQQLTLADAFKSSLNTAEDHVRHAAIDAIAAVRQRERELLDGLRSFVGDDAMRFLDERDTLGLRLEELDNIRETTETMVGRTNVELLMTKKEVHERLHTALGHQQIQTPDKVRLGGVHYVAGAKPFHDLHRPTPDIAKLFRSVADNNDVGDHVVENHVTDRSSPSSSSSSESETDSDDSDSEDEGHQPGTTVQVVSELPQLEHIDLLARWQDESETEEDSDDDDDDDDDSDDEDDKNEPVAPMTKICISDGVVRRMVIKSQSLCDVAEDRASPPSRPSGRKIPDFSRPKPTVTYVSRGTEMERLHTTDAATATPRVVVCDKETYTGYVCLVHKNVSTDNQGTSEKGTSTAHDVTAVYRNVSNSGRSATISRGTNTLKAMTFDRASSPIAAPRVPTAANNPPAAVAKVPAYPTSQRPGTVQVPPVTQKSSTSNAVSVTTPQIPPNTGKLQADTQKAPGAANMAVRMPQVTSPTTPTTPAQPVPTTTVTASQRQNTPAVTSPTRVGPTSSKLPPSSQKLVISSSAVSTSLPPIVATAPSQSVTSPPQVMTSSVVAVSTPSQQRQPPALTSSATSASAAATSSGVRINSPVIAVAGERTASTITSIAAQKPIASSHGVRSKDSPSPSTQPSTTQAASQPAASTDTSQSTDSNRRQSALTSPVIPANKQLATPLTSSTTVPTAVAPASARSPPPASMQKLLTPEQASLPRQPQPSTGRAPSAMLPRQSALDAAPATQLVAVTSSSQTASPLTQVSNVVQQRTALTSSVPQKTSQSQTTAPGIVSVATTPTAQKLMTSALSQTQPTSNMSPINVTSTISPQSQLQSTSSSMQASNTVTNSMHVPATAQKLVTSLVSPTPQPQPLTVLPTSITTSAQIMTSQTATNSNHISNVATSVPLVSTTTRNSMTATTLSSAQMSATSTAAQKPVASLVSATTHPQRPTTLPMGITSTAQIMTSLQATTSNSQLSNAATSVAQVSTTGRNSMTATTVSSAQMPASTIAQKPVTSLASYTTQPQPSTLLTTTTQSTSQLATSNNDVSNAAASIAQVSTTGRNSTMATTVSSAQMPASTTAQKPVTSLASSTTQPQPSTLTTTAQSTSQLATSNNHVSNSATSMPEVSTTAQKLMTSDNGQLESVTSPSTASSTAVVEYSAALATTQLAVTPDSLVPSTPMSASRVSLLTTASNSSRPRSVFRSISMDNLRAPAPVLRPPPPIMTTSVAAVTQRLNGGAANGSTKNGCKSNK